MINEDSLLGATANPSIFEKAILGSDDYDEALAAMAHEHLDAQTIYERLAVEDVQRACDVFREAHDAHNGLDGFVSLEVGPEIAHDAQRTIEAARDFWHRVSRPNVMIKIPGTVEGAVDDRGGDLRGHQHQRDVAVRDPGLRERRRGLPARARAPAEPSRSR